MSPPSFQTINITLENHIATFVYNNPKANALSVQLLRELIEALTWANDSSDVKVIIVTGGESKFFTAGLDLTNVPETGPVLPDASIEYLRQIHALLITTSKITIAAVNGTAIGWGTTSIALFDLVYATPTAIFATPFLKVGLCAEACSSLTFRLAMGRQKASALLLAGDQLTAQDLEKAGLVTKIFPKETFLGDVTVTARGIAKYPAGALETNKRLIVEPMRAELLAANERECEALKERGKTDEPRKAIEAFAKEQSEKRKGGKL